MSYKSIWDFGREGKDIPESFKNLLFPPKEEPKEIESGRVK